MNGDAIGIEIYFYAGFDRPQSQFAVFAARYVKVFVKPAQIKKILPHERNIRAGQSVGFGQRRRRCFSL